MGRQNDDGATLRTLRRELKKGKSVLRIARETGNRQSHLLRLAVQHGLDYPNRPATEAQRSKVIDACVRVGLSIRQAAAAAGISRSAAHRIIFGYREQATALDPSEAEFEPICVPAYRCPRGHGLMTVSPCPACEADEYRRNL